MPSAARLLRVLRRLPPGLQNVLLALATAVAFGGTVEALARLAEARRPARPVADYVADWDAWGGEFYTAVGAERYADYYNRDGLRDREHALEAEAGVERLVFLGDSTTFGHGLDAEQAYPQVLQRLLNDRGGAFEVFNVALPGWSARQQRLAYRRIVRRYRPRQVFLAVCLNDVPDLQNNLTRPPAWLAALFRRSALVRRALRAEARQIREVEELFAQPPPPRVQAGFARLFEEIGTLADEVAADGARFGLLIFPFRFQLEEHAPPPRPQQRLAAFASARRLPFMDLLPTFQARGAGLFLDEDHFTAEGARLVAQALLTADLIDLPSAARSAAGPLHEQLDRLRSADTRVAVQAARALGFSGADVNAVVAALSHALEHPGGPVRAAAAQALGGIGAPAAAASAALLAALRDPVQDVRLRAAEALARVAPPVGPTVAGLVRLLVDPTATGRYEAVRVLGELGAQARPAVAALALATADTDPHVRAQAIWALGRIGPPAGAAVPALVAILDRGVDDALRWRAVDVLGRVGPAAAVATESLARCLTADPDGDVRRLAARALGRIGRGARGGQDALLEALGDRRADVRLAAARAIPRVGADPRQAVPALVRLQDDDADSGVRAEARSALKKLRRAARQ